MPLVLLSKPAGASGNGGARRRTVTARREIPMESFMSTSGLVREIYPQVPRKPSRNWAQKAIIESDSHGRTSAAPTYWSEVSRNDYPHAFKPRSYVRPK